jgi:radical SAM-linked protein
METLKEEIGMKIIYPLKHPEMYKAYGKAIGGGVLMYGPPGCGKTLLARATAGETQAGFAAVGSSDVLDMWIGASEGRFIGTKEVATLFARATRRARLPVAYSQGFHPLPRLSFGPALPLGLESEEEFLDIELTELLVAAEVGDRLGAELPRGFTMQRAEAIDLKARSVDASIRAFRYAAALDSLPAHKQAPGFLAARLTEFHAATTFPMRKHTRSGEKVVDAKQFIAGVALTAPLTLSIETAMTDAGTIKPHEFAGLLLGLTPEEVKVLRLTKIQTLFHSCPDPSLDETSEEVTDTPLLTAAG